MADESTQNPSFSGSPKEHEEQNAWELGWPGDTLDQFCQWFWKDSNGNQLIEKLNDFSGKQSKWRGHYDKIRREKDSPTIYSIVVNDERLDSIWKICKVGYTGISTEEGTGNRMEKVMEKIKNEKKEKKYKAASIIFKLPIHSIDSSPIRETEDRIRLNIGWKIDTGLVNKLKLPNETEWILTKQDYLDTLKKAVDEKKKTEQIVTTKIFTEKEDLKFEKYMNKEFLTAKSGLPVEQWMNQKIPQWLELRSAGTTSGGKQQETKFEVYQNGSLPDKLKTMLKKFDK